MMHYDAIIKRTIELKTELLSAPMRFRLFFAIVEICHDGLTNGELLQILRCGGYIQYKSNSKRVTTNRMRLRLFVHCVIADRLEEELERKIIDDLSYIDPN